MYIQYLNGALSIFFQNDDAKQDDAPSIELESVHLEEPKVTGGRWDLIIGLVVSGRSLGEIVKGGLELRLMSKLDARLSRKGHLICP